MVNVTCHQGASYLAQYVVPFFGLLTLCVLVLLPNLPGGDS